MQKTDAVQKVRWKFIVDGLDSLIYAASTYALPIVIGLLSLVALTVWPLSYAPATGTPLAFQVAEDQDAALSPAQALVSLKEAAAVEHLDTRRSEQPFWMLFTVPRGAPSMPLAVEFPSRHAASVACWDAGSLRSLGQANRSSAEGSLSLSKAGFALAVTSASTPLKLLCRANAIGPARLSLALWEVPQLQAAQEEFHRNAGMLSGGLIVLALFVLVTALVNRESTYLLFATWLLLNLRMAALSAGWDTQWLGHAVPISWLTASRALTLALYYVVTFTLFKSLFKDALAQLGLGTPMRAVQWAGLPLLMASLLLPYGQFLPTIWITTAIGIGIVTFLLVRILMKTRSRVAMWYAASMAITLFASFYEVVAAALGAKGFIGNINSVTAALSSSLLASLAIAEQMRQEHQQRLAVQAELEHTYEATPIGLFTLDLSGRFMSANPAMGRMLGPDLLTPGGGRDWHRYFGNTAWMQLHHMVHAQADGELEIRREGGDPADGPKRYLVKATRAHHKIEGSLQDVTEKARATEDLQFMANNDALTKVLNRRGIEKILNHAMQQLSDGRPLALAYLDLDRFKLINDLYGHNAGDEVLQLVCKRVGDMLSAGMQMGRVGGDEFVIVLPDTRIPLATVICQGIVDSIGATPYQIGDKAFHVRGSIGLIEVAAHTRLKDVMSTADRACREAKSGVGGDGLVVYEKNAPAFLQHEAELQLVERLASSSALEGLFVEMQPIMSLTAPLDSLNFEVLLRMRGPDGKLVPTDRLISAGESSGHMGKIDRWVLSTTLAWLNTHAERLTRTRFVCMNLSGASVNDEAFTRDVFAMLAQNIHIAGHLCLEITETVALHDLENTRRFIDRVRSYGAKVALDDFGAGYTSFSYLKVLSADLLKIDGSFIVNMNSHPANVAIVEAIVSLARNLGMKTIAEWAEDNATVQTLAEIGVDYVQGYAVARPQAPDDILAATSSASFIKDEGLSRLVKLMGQPGADLLQEELFAPNKPRSVH